MKYLVVPSKVSERKREAIDRLALDPRFALFLGKSTIGIPQANPSDVAGRIIHNCSSNFWSGLPPDVEPTFMSTHQTNGCVPGLQLTSVTTIA